MKKGSARQLIVLILAVIFAAAIIFYFLSYQSFDLANFGQLTAKIPLLNPAVEKIKPVVSTPPPLVSAKPASDSVLTQIGVLAWTNNQRRQNDLANLAANEKLNAAAQAKVEDMFKNQYFAHVSLAGLGVEHWADQSGYEYVALGENLALGNYESDQDLVQAWMDSSGHRANILNTSFEEIGIAVKNGEFEGQDNWLAVQVFGKPMSSCPSVDQNLSLKVQDNQTQLETWQGQIEVLAQRLETQRPKGRSSQEEIDAYNAIIDQYNQLVESYNALTDQTKKLVDQYNAQAAAFNACAESS